MRLRAGHNPSIFSVIMSVDGNAVLLSSIGRAPCAYATGLLQAQDDQPQVLGGFEDVRRDEPELSQEFSFGQGVPETNGNLGALFLARLQKKGKKLEQGMHSLYSLCYKNSQTCKVLATEMVSGPDPDCYQCIRPHRLNGKHWRLICLQCTRPSALFKHILA